MREAAAADDQHTFLAQRGERTADAKVMFGSEMRLDRELQNWNVGLRIHQQ